MHIGIPEIHVDGEDLGWSLNVTRLPGAPDHLWYSMLRDSVGS
jgi:hypothetical protein